VNYYCTATISNSDETVIGLSQKSKELELHKIPLHFHYITHIYSDQLLVKNISPPTKMTARHFSEVSKAPTPSMCIVSPPDFFEVNSANGIQQIETCVSELSRNDKRQVANELFSLVRLKALQHCQLPLPAWEVIGRILWQSSQIHQRYLQREVSMTTMVRWCA
jgi:hypothetical protein